MILRLSPIFICRDEVSAISFTKKQAEPLTLKEEELLSEKRIIGNQNLKALQCSWMDYIFLYVVEQSIINWDTSHAKLKSLERELTWYIVSKNHPGGLKGLKYKRWL